MYKSRNKYYLRTVSYCMSMVIILAVCCLFSTVKAADIGIPNTPVISHNNWDNDGNYDVTMNMWWGNNGSLWTLYENGELVHTATLTDNSPNAQTDSINFTGKTQGKYTYKCVLTNSYGSVTSSEIIVNVTSAPLTDDSSIGTDNPDPDVVLSNPDTPTISHNNWDNDGDYDITMNMWWGNNGTSWTLYENGELVHTATLTDNSPNAQIDSVTFTGKDKGTYKYKCVLTNSFGSVTSPEITVNVTVVPPTDDPGIGGVWSQNIFAPYVDVMLWPQFSISDCFDKTNQKYYTLAFITSDTAGNPAWGGVTSLNDNYYMAEIKSIRDKGGDVIISFGGANGTELACAQQNTDVATLQAKYQEVIDKYQVTWVDFDIEGGAVNDKPSIDLRNKAIKGLQEANPDLTIAYCLPVLPSGLTHDGEYVLVNAKENGVRVDVVNVMAMDYGDSTAPNPDGKMGDYAIQAATNTYNQCKEIGLNTNIGVTPMIGRNDVQTEVFYQTDAQKLLNWATSKSWVRLLSMWSSTRDNGSGGALNHASPNCSSLEQEDFEFTNIFKDFND